MPMSVLTSEKRAGDAPVRGAGRLSWRGALLPGLVVLAAGLPAVLGDYGMHVANTGLILGIAAMALTTLMGPAGLLSLGEAAFLAIGAFTAGYLATAHDFGFLAATAAAGLAAMAAGGLVALATVRALGLYLAIGTFALQYVVELILTDVEVKWTQAVGILMPVPSVLGFEIVGETRWWGLNVVVAVLVYGVLAWVRRGHVGRAWIAARDEATVASALGISLAWCRVSAFALTSFIAGIAGALHGYYAGIVQITSFPLHLSIVFVTICVLGGLGSLPGAVAAAYVVVILPHALQMLMAQVGLDAESGRAGVENIALGVILGAVLLRAPQRLVSLARRAPAGGRAQEEAPGSDSPASDARVPAVALAEAPAARSPAPILELRGLQVAYGPNLALRDVSLSLAPREALALVGHNGAGKSTTLLAIAGAGAGRIVSGQVLLDGKVPPTAFRARQRLGLSLVPEREKVFSLLTVEENLRAADPGGEIRRDDVFGWFPRLGERRRTLAGNLSGGEQQMLAIAMALLGSPRVLLVDEPTLGLSVPAIEQLCETLGEIRRSLSVALLVAEAQSQWVTRLADRAIVLDRGQVAGIVGPGLSDRKAEIDALQLGVGLGAVREKVAGARP